MRGRVRAALAAAVFVGTIGSGAALALPVAAATRSAAPSRTPAEPLSKMRMVPELTNGRAFRAGAMPQLASSAPCTPSVAPGFCSVASPNFGADWNYLNDIAAVAPNDVWAVGTYVNGSTVYQTLAEHWNGSAWSVIPTPNVGAGNNLLTSVTAIGPGDVWAVGLTRPGNTSTAAQPLTEHWNGNNWIVVPTGITTFASTPLYGVSADASNDVWAVGISANFPNGGPFVIRWNGSAWSYAVSPNAIVRTSGLTFAGLNAVKVFSADDVWVVGDGANFNGSTQVSPDTAFSSHWTGSFWTAGWPDMHPNGDFLSDVQGAPGDIWAVGGQGQPGSTTSDNVLIVHTNGGPTWADYTGVTPGLSANLFGLGYLSPDNVYAVGTSASANPGTTMEIDRTLVERWNGINWSQVPSEHPSTSTSEGLNAIAAITSNDVWAAGLMESGPLRTLTENYSAPPVVSSIAPSSGNAGTRVVITGSGFSRAIDVEFGSTPAFSFHVDSDTQITAVSPGHKAGTVDIRVTVQGTSAVAIADQFTYSASRSGPGAGSGKPFPGRTGPPPPVLPQLAHLGARPRGAPIPI